jgi:NTE family protein
MTTRALVLGGGGPVGIAWESGLLAGLAERGVDLSEADFIMGTSAGSFVGAQLAMGQAPSTLAAPYLAPAEPAATSPSSSNQPAPPAPDLTVLITKMQEAISGARPAEQVRAEIGAWALQAKTICEEAFISGFGRGLSGLPDDAWPKRPYACTAVDAADGSFVVWNQESGVGVTRAVASSCSVPGVFPPITIKGRRYVDGGMRSATNADVAKGYDVVLVVSVTSAAMLDSPMAEPFRRTLERELKTLREGGARVELITPDDGSAKAFGINLMDASRRGDSAREGLRQGRAGAERLAALWGGKIGIGEVK